MLNTCSIPVVNLQMITTFQLNQEKQNLFNSHYLATHLTHLHHQLFCLLANLSSWQSLSSRSHFTFRSFWYWWYFEGSNRYYRRANYCLLSTIYLLILMSRPPYFVLSVFSLWLCTMEIVIFQSHWKSLSIICWEKSGSFLGIVILASFTSLVLFKTSLMLLFIVQVCRVEKQEAQEFL